MCGGADIFILLRSKNVDSSKMHLRVKLIFTKILLPEKKFKEIDLGLTINSENKQG